MYLSMAVKNIFGIVKGVRKSWLHMRHGHSHHEFAEIILDLHTLLGNTVTIADGIEVMHRHGPMSGEALALRCLAGSKSAVALDTAMIELLELESGRSPLSCVASRRGIIGADLAEIVFPSRQPADFFGSGFQAPERLIPVRFNPLRYGLNSLKKAILRLRPE
jgi:uncharacterized protein (DUF362 family)